MTLPSGAAGRRPTFTDARHGWIWDPSPAALYVTSDGGAHWRRVAATGLPMPWPATRRLAFRDASHGWAADAAGSSAPAIYATIDGGTSWTEVPLPAPDGGWTEGSRFDVGPMAIAADGHGQLKITELMHWDFRLIAAFHWVAATADGGTTWSAPRRMPDVPPGT